MSKVIMSGDEAVARGAWEAGVGVAAAYPGTPSTEILENISLYKEDVYCQWANNEKIAVEIALGASFGEGIFAMKAALMKKAREGLKTVADWMENNKRRMCQFFTVDDLMFLHKGGRLSGFTARFGSIANIKPLLKGDSEGRIVTCGKVIGRKKSLQAIADLFDKHAEPDCEDVVAIAHSDCEDDANYLADLLKRKRSSLKDVLIRCYEPGTGSHVGPGAVALFFFSPVAVK